MRKGDKKHNMSKVNLLAEQRYLESKGLITESKYFADVLDKGTKIKFDGKDAVIVGHLFNPGQEAIYTIKYDDGSTKENVIANDRRIEKINESFGISENEKLKADDKIMWIGDDKIFPYGEPTKKGDIGRYLGQDGNGHAVSFSKVFYTGESDFKKI
jgi:hypothetical protein